MELNMGSDTNELDTREDDKRMYDKNFNNEKEVIKLEPLEAMEAIETIVEEWQAGHINSEEALEKITTITDEL